MKFTDHGHSNKHIATQEINRLAADNFADRLRLHFSKQKCFCWFCKKDRFWL